MESHILAFNVGYDSRKQVLKLRRPNFVHKNLLRVRARVDDSSGRPFCLMRLTRLTYGGGFLFSRIYFYVKNKKKLGAHCTKETVCKKVDKYVEQKRSVIKNIVLY